MRGDRLVLPVNEIITGSMSPMVRTPNSSVWAILIEQVINTFIINHTVRVVHPFFFLSKMDLRPVLFAVQLLCICMLCKCAVNKNGQYEKIFYAFHSSLYWEFQHLFILRSFFRRFIYLLKKAN